VKALFQYSSVDDCHHIGRVESKFRDAHNSVN